MTRGMVGGKREKHGVSDGHEYRFTKRKKKRGTQTQTQSQVHVDALLIASSHRIPSRIASSTALDLLTLILSKINNNKGHKDNDYGDLLVSDAFLAITPTLLRSRLSKMLLQTLEILGFAALYSYEKNRKVADDNEIIVVIISLLSSNNEDIVKGACNAMLDLATTLTGRRQLQEHKAIDQLLWEGMLHIALHCWRENLESDHFIKICGSENCYFLLIQLLHVSIRVVGSHCSILRKACTASALFPACNDAIGQSDTELLPPKQIFHCLIKLVAESCNLSDAYENVGEAFRDFRDDDPLEWMKWFRHLRTNDASNQQHWYSPAKQTRSLFLVYQTSILDYETAFLQIKSKFCEETNFDEAHKVFNSLLNKYRNARKRYSEGMLALHQS